MKTLSFLLLWACLAASFAASGALSTALAGLGIFWAIVSLSYQIPDLFDRQSLYEWTLRKIAGRPALPKPDQAKIDAWLKELDEEG